MRITSFLCRGLVVLMLVTTFQNVHAEINSSDQEWLQKLPKSWTLTEDTLGEVLPLFHKKYPDYDDRLRALSMWRLGTPYKIFNLGEEQAPDFDPIFRMDVSDCTSHILTTLALAESKTWQEAKATLIDIHYKGDVSYDKQPTYKTRWHYTTDRLLHHPMTPDVTDEYIDSSKLTTVSVHLNQKQDGSEFLDLNWSLPVKVRYIPNAYINAELLESLPDMIGVAFVKASYFKMDVVMAHEGKILDGKYLLHAGQVAQKTVREDFMRYYFGDNHFGDNSVGDENSPNNDISTENPARFDGIMLYRLLPISAFAANS